MGRMKCAPFLFCGRVVRRLYRKGKTYNLQGIFHFVSVCAKKHMACREKYKPYILKYKALISKYVPCIFREKRHLIFNDLQNRKNSVFPHRCARKKIIRNGMYTSPQTVHRFRRADGFYTHAACVSKAPECRCKNTV